MSIATLILGNSGTGKSTSLRNLDPAKVLLLQAIKKPLPFRAKGWDTFNTTDKTGSVFVTDKAAHIQAAISKAKSIGKEIVIIDDFQYILANEFMRRVTDIEKGNAAFQKFNEIAKAAWDVMNAAIGADDDLRVYILSHSQSDEYGGNVKIKTVGKLLDEKVVLEGMLTIVLRSHVKEGKYFLTTQNDGSDTVKSPMGLFEDLEIDNDLAAIDKKICEYYEIGEQA